MRLKCRETEKIKFPSTVSPDSCSSLVITSRKPFSSQPSFRSVVRRGRCPEDDSLIKQGKKEKRGKGSIRFTAGSVLRKMNNAERLDWRPHQFCLSAEVSTSPYLLPVLSLRQEEGMTDARCVLTNRLLFQQQEHHVEREAGEYNKEGPQVVSSGSRSPAPGSGRNLRQKETCLFLRRRCLLLWQSLRLRRGHRKQQRESLVKITCSVSLGCFSFFP